ncbi:hypothetical protein Tco_1020085 [Tanacetum coccineum]|uniref:Integrase, catalytic region, zinc finger, CCHC-type, peptidase aspartic, catalytic n=1 Tax=Tanacetum coccineum TaxID=301880 RepID=A0ABQ5FZA6_9ASTR
MMRLDEVHKFSDGTFTRVLDKLDHMVKDFWLFKFNPGMETRIWSEDDKRRSKEFMEVIERRLKIGRIYKSLESFMSGRIRDVDYRLMQQTALFHHSDTQNSLAEYMILSGADNRPPMLDKELYDPWKENGVTRTKKYAELSAAEKIQADCVMKVTNIILQGLPADIYSLVNHHRVAKDLWERVQLLMQAISSNTKFLNSLPPEWSKFVTDIKLVKDLHTTNFDQLHAYLEQHELHANEVRLLRERNQDPLAFVANQQMTPPHFNTYQSSYNNP